MKIFGFVLSFVSCSFFLWSIDYDFLKKSFENVQYISISFVLLSVFISYFFTALRLKNIFSTLSFSEAWRISQVCSGANNIFPAKFGEILKWRLLLRKKYTKTYVTVAILIERGVELLLIVLLSLFCFSNYFWGSNSSIIVFCFLFFLLFLFFSFLCRKIFLEKVLMSKNLIVTKCCAIIENLKEHMTKVWFGKILLYSIFVQLSYFFIFGTAMYMLIPSVFSLGTIVFVTLAGSLGVALPAAPGGIGVFEGAIVLALKVYHIPLEESLFFAIITHLCIALPCIFQYFIYTFFYKNILTVEQGERLYENFE